MDTALNRAHQQERKAELLFRAAKFDEAIECHEKTADLLKEAMQCTTARLALESIQLQYNYHINRRKVIRYKQHLMERIKAVSEQMSIMFMNDTFKYSKDDSKSEQACDSLKAMHRITTENDSLLRGLVTGDFDIPLTRDFHYMNIPQDDKTVIEELKINNQELKRLADILSKDLEKSKDENQKLKLENQSLRRQLLHYEIERNKPHTATVNSLPFIFSSGDQSPEILHEIPNLPPLEMPNFDFNRFPLSPKDKNTKEETTNKENP